MQKTSTFFFVMSTWNPYEVVIMKASIQGVTAAGVTLPDPPAPFRFDLQQNYPNPFNPSTTIRYGLPTRSHVTPSVSNTLGQQVVELVNGNMDAGFHEVRFDGTNLASGVYFYRLQAGTFVQTKKFLMLH